jgi:hypothetical protein
MDRSRDRRHCRVPAFTLAVFLVAFSVAKKSPSRFSIDAESVASDQRGERLCMLSRHTSQAWLRDGTPTVYVVNVVEHYDHVIVTANINGNFDGRGLPDPLVLAFYFSAPGLRIVQLIALPKQFGT